MNLVRIAFVTAALTPLVGRAAEAGTPPVDRTISSELTGLRTKAEQGDAQAQYELGLAFSQGSRGPRDLVEAFVWLTLAGEHGVSGDALEPVVDGLQFSQLVQTRRRLESLRATFPSLRSPEFPPARKAPLVDDAGILPPKPATANSSQDSPSPADTKRRHEQLSTAESQLSEARTNLAKQSAELATLRAESEAGRAELERAQTQLGTAKEALALSAAKAFGPNGAGALLEREQAAHASTQTALADANRQVAELTTTRAALQRELAACATLSERENLAASREAVQQTGRANEIAGKANALEREVAQTRAELESAREALAVAGRKAAADSVLQARQIATLESKLNDASRQLSDAKKGILKAIAENKPASVRTDAITHATAGNAATEAALATANQKLAESTRELQALRQRMDDGQRQLPISPSQPSASLETVLNELRVKLGAAEKVASDRSYEVAGLRVALNANASRGKAAAADVEAAQREAAQTRQQLASALSELTSLRTQVSAARDLEARVHQLEAEKKAP